MHYKFYEKKATRERKREKFKLKMCFCYFSFFIYNQEIAEERRGAVGEKKKKLMRWYIPEAVWDLLHIFIYAKRVVVSSPQMRVESMDLFSVYLEYGIYLRINIGIPRIFVCLFHRLRLLWNEILNLHKHLTPTCEW